MADGGHGSLINHKGEEAIGALLVSRTPMEAAEKIGVSARTLRGWLAKPKFARRYRDARRVILESGLANLQRGVHQAVDVLIAALASESATVRLSAARSILDHSIRAVDWLDIESRLAEVEAKAKGK